MLRSQAQDGNRPDSKGCGTTIKFAFIRHIQIGGPAFDPNACCKLESTIAHEGYHLAVGFGHPDAPGGPADIEKKCFNCGTGHP